MTTVPDVAHKVAEEPHAFASTAHRSARSVRQKAERARRFGSIGLLASGLITVISAVTPSLTTRLRRVEDLLPVAVHQAVFLVAAVGGLVLIQLARGVRRGQRRAWWMAVVLTIVIVVTHTLKSIDVEESAATALTGGYLVINHAYFRAPTDPEPLRRAVVPLFGGAIVAVLAAFVSVVFRRRSLSVTRSVLAVVERLGAVSSISIGGRLDHFLTPALAGVGASVVLGFAWLVVRPALWPLVNLDPIGRSRAIVEKYGSGTLAYFALRGDKRHWIYGDTLVSYGVYSGVCLVSPDPIGPTEERVAAWAAFQTFTTDHGWQLGVLGAGEDFLDTYEASGMRKLYVGDEAIVDVATFTLDGGAMKGLRQAVNRVANKGYNITFHDPAHVDASLMAALLALMAESRKGDVERGFSMTLSRLFDPIDTGLLLAVCHGPDGTPAAFCQYVPAGVDGFSLDLMRRAIGDHPNGLTDFVLVRTIERLADDGHRFLSLNFATMRAVLAGESGDGRGQQVERWVLGRLSGSMQIESLWKYNAKFRPRWQPRFLVYHGSENLVPIALAVAKAESIWELPVIGALMKPRRSPVVHEPATA